MIIITVCGQEKYMYIIIIVQGILMQKQLDVLTNLIMCVYTSRSHNYIEE